MSIDIATFRIRFPEFVDDTEFPDARIQLFLDDSVLLYLGSDEIRWGGKYDIAQAYTTAHLLTVAGASEVGDTNGKAGVINSKTAGGVSVSRAVVAVDRSDIDSFFMGTTYGQQFLNVRDMCFIGVVIANSL